MKFLEEHRAAVFFYLCAFFAATVVYPLAFSFLLALILGYVCENSFRFLLLRWLKVQKGKKTAHKKLARKIPHLQVFENIVKPAFSAFYISSIVLLIFVPFVFSCVFVFNQTAQLLASQDAMKLAPKVISATAAFLSAQLEGFGIEVSIAQILAHARTLLVGISDVLLRNMQQLLSGTPVGIAQTVAFLFTWHLCLVRGRSWRRKFLPLLIPFDRERNIIAATTGDVLRAVVLSNVIVSLCQAVLVGVLFLATGVPNALVWAGLSFFTSFIPVLGTAGVILGAAGYLYANGGTIAPIVLLIGSLAVGLADNILRPIFVKGSVNLNFFWIMIAFFGGVSQYGIAGTVLGPLAFALFLASLRCFRG